MTSKGVCLPRTNISVAVLVCTLTMSVRFSFDKISDVNIISLEHLFSFSSSKAISPVTIVISTIFVSKLALTMVEIVKETSFVLVSVVL